MKMLAATCGLAYGGRRIYAQASCSHRVNSTRLCGLLIHSFLVNKMYLQTIKQNNYGMGEGNGNVDAVKIPIYCNVQ